jgi:hypothetical protein
MASVVYKPFMNPMPSIGLIITLFGWFYPSDESV